MGVNWSGAGSGAISGATAGSSFGPWGTAIGGVAGGVMGLFSKKKKGATRPSYVPVNIPDFTADDYVGRTQDYLYDFGTDMLEGYLPETYKPLIEFGSQQLEDMLGLTNRDISKSVTESAARTGMGRSGVMQSNIAKATADASVKARYGDYSTTLGNLKSLLGYGLDTVSGVGSKALTNQWQMNNYNLGATELAIRQNKLLYDSGVEGFNYDSFVNAQEPGMGDYISGIGSLLGSEGSAETKGNVLQELLSLFK